MKIYRLVSYRHDKPEKRKEHSFNLNLYKARKELLLYVIEHNRKAKEPEWLDIYGNMMLEFYHKVSINIWQTDFHKICIEELEVSE